MKKIKILCMALAVVLITSCTTFPAYANEQKISAPIIEQQISDGLITPFWSDVNTIVNNFNISSGTAKVLVDVYAKSNITSFSVSVVIQKKSLLVWKDHITIPTKTFSGKTGVFSESRSVGSGTYRTKTTVKAYQNGTLNETITLYGNTAKS